MALLQDVFLGGVLHAAVIVGVFGVWGEVDVGLVVVFVLDVFEVDDHVQGVGQDQQQDEGGDEAHEDGGGQEGGAVTGRREFT